MANLIDLRRQLARDQAILDALGEKIRENPAWPTSATYQVIGEIYFSIQMQTKEIIHLENAAGDKKP